MALEYLKVGIRRLILKHNVCVARVVSKGRGINNVVFDLSKNFNEANGKTYTITADRNRIYYESGIFGFVPVVYFDEDFTSQISIDKPEGVTASELKALFENEQAIQRAIFWSKANWLLGDVAKIGSVLLLLGIVFSAFFAFSGANASTECVTILKGHIATNVTTLTNTG